MRYNCVSMETDSQSSKASLVWFIARNSQSTTVKANTMLTNFISTLMVCHLFHHNSAQHDQPLWPWKEVEFPRPHTHWRVCNNVSHEVNICDPDRLLALFQVKELSRLLVTIKNETVCECGGGECGGLVVGIGLAKQTFYDHSAFHLNSDQTLNQGFAEGLRKTNNEWRELSACGSDLIVFIAHNNQKVSISAGIFTHKVLGHSLQVITEHVQHMFANTKNAEYFEFLTQITRMYAQEFSKRLKVYNTSAFDQLDTDHNHHNHHNQHYHWLPWRSSQPLATLLTIGYCLALLLLLTIGCYCCCGKDCSQRNDRKKSDKNEKMSERIETNEMTNTL